MLKRARTSSNSALSCTFSTVTTAHTALAAILISKGVVFHAAIRESSTLSVFRCLKSLVSSFPLRSCNNCTG